MIKVRGLTKYYGNTKAVDSIDIDIEKGHIYGFLGPNGAGKTSTLGMITGTLASSGGSVTVCGADIQSEPVTAKRHIGYLPENPPLYNDMTVCEYLSFVAEAKGIKRADIFQTAKKAMLLTDVYNVSDKLIRSLSKGFRQRVGIAQAILGDPDVIIFDEPTVGLDPKQVVEVRALIKKISKNRTVVLSSHILSEIEEICDRILIINSGRIVACDSLEKLQREYTGNNIVTLRAKCKPQRAEEIIRSVKKTDRFEVKKCDAGALATVETPCDTDVRDTLFFAFAKAGVAIVEMNAGRLTLEDVFLKVTSGESGTSDHRDEPEEDGPESETQNDAKTESVPENNKKGDTDDDDDDGDDYRPLFG